MAKRKADPPVVEAEPVADREVGGEMQVVEIAQQPPVIYSRARGADVELGRAFAALLAEKHSHQLGVCGRLGIPWQTHMTWMAKTPEPGSDLAEYQREVLAALDRQRVADLEDIDTTLEQAPDAKTSTLWNVRKHRHESRFRRFYEPETPLVSKVELTGKDGAPIAVTAAPPTRAQAVSELARLLGMDAEELAQRLASGDDVAGLLGSGGEDE